MSGYAPDRAVTFFCFAKRKSPKKRRPRRRRSGWGRTALRCSVFGARAELAAFTSFTALRQAARSQFTKRAVARGPKPLRSSTPPTGPKSNTSLAARAFHPHLGADAKRGEWRRNRSMCAACPKHGNDRPNPCSRSETTKSAGVRRLCFGYFHLTRQMKVTRPPGRNPGAPAGRQKKPIREAEENLKPPAVTPHSSPPAKSKQQQTPADTQSPPPESSAQTPRHPETCASAK